MDKGHDSVEERVAVAVEAFRQRPRLLALRCGVQHYDWGGLDYIPALLGIQNRNRRPFAELWVGAHPDLPSTATIGGTDVTLNALIEGAAAQVLVPAGGTVLIGKDTRLSGYMFESALEAGFVAAGADVLLLGPLPTPGIANLTQVFNATWAL